MDDNRMSHYLVKYTDPSSSDGETWTFMCWADDVEHAKEQRLNTEPDACIMEVWCHVGSSKKLVWAQNPDTEQYQSPHWDGNRIEEWGG